MPLSSYPAALGIPDRRCYCLALYQFQVRCAIFFAVIWIIWVPIPVKPISSVRNPFRCAVLITVNRMMVDFSDMAYVQCVSSCWHHQSVKSGNQNVLLTYIGLEWKWLRVGMICPQFFGASGGEFKLSLAAVNKRAAPSLRPGVISASLLGVKYSSSLLDKSYWSKDDWQDPEVVMEGMTLLHCNLSSLLTGTRRCLAQFSFSSYF